MNTEVYSHSSHSDIFSLPISSSFHTFAAHTSLFLFEISSLIVCKGKIFFINSLKNWTHCKNHSCQNRMICDTNCTIQFDSWENRYRIVEGIVFYHESDESENHLNCDSWTILQIKGFGWPYEKTIHNLAVESENQNVEWWLYLTELLKNSVLVRFIQVPR